MHNNRMILAIPAELVTSFKTGAKQLSKVAAFHEANGNESVAEAVETAAEMSHSL